MAWAGPLIALMAVAFGVVAFLRLPPRPALAAALMAGGVALGALRQFAFAVPLAALGFSLWRAAPGARARPSPGQVSEVRTGGRAMTLDHDSGAMDGEVLVGAFTGARLSDLSADDLQMLVVEFEGTGDEDSLSLLLAYLERRGGGEASGAAEPPPSGAAGLSTAEAYRILGLDPGATAGEVRAAHHRLMRRVHPDLGGSDALAALINAAKEKLDPD
jgi:hypothetical protein